MELFLPGFIFCGIIVGLLAKRKNRNVIGWGIAGGLSWLMRCWFSRSCLISAQGAKKICQMTMVKRATALVAEISKGQPRQQPNSNT
jgi:hypothetical protein